MTLYRRRGLGPNFDGTPNELDHAVCHSSLGWIWGLRVICSVRLLSAVFCLSCHTTTTTTVL